VKEGEGGGRKREKEKSKKYVNICVFIIL